MLDLHIVQAVANGICLRAICTSPDDGTSCQVADNPLLTDTLNLLLNLSGTFGM
jgi:hypothetical protein